MSFKDINPRINEYMQLSPIGMQDGIMFVVLSIKTPFHTMKTQMQDYKENGLDSKYVWGFKKDTLQYLLNHSGELYDDLMELWMTPKKELGGTADSKDAAMMMRLLEVPGLGMVKAGFVMQMMFGRVGCMDVHNTRRFYKIDIKDVQVSKGLKSDAKKFQKIVGYVQLCKNNRSTSKLWDSWCEQLVYKPCNRGRFDTGNDVSQFHLQALLV